MRVSYTTSLVVSLLAVPITGLANRGSASRRAWLQQTAAGLTSLAVAAPAVAANPDCFTDCQRECLVLAPKDTLYCRETCRDYCEQPDRADGLSGSISSTGGEVGILGGTFGQGTVVRSEDRPPSVRLPGLDFSGTAGRQLLGL